MSHSSDRSPPAYRGRSMCLAAPAEAGQGVGTCRRCAGVKSMRNLIFAQALLEVGYGVLLGVSLSLAAFIYVIDVIARDAQAVL